MLSSFMVFKYLLSPNISRVSMNEQKNQNKFKLILFPDPFPIQLSLYSMEA